MNAAILALVILATARINRLIVTDIITSPIRGWLAQRTSKLGAFLSAITSCVWCTGVYTAAAVTAYAHYAADWSWVYFPLTFLAVAWTAPVLANWIEA